MRARVLALVAACASACGARTGLLVDDVPDASDVTDAADVTDVAIDRAPPPPVCDDGVACTRDQLVPGTRRCASMPDDLLCPISHRCDATRGCIARALTHSNGRLYEVQLPSGVVRELAPVRAFTDIALHPDRTLYAVSGDGVLWRLDDVTGFASIVAATRHPLTALDAAPDGTLYGAGREGLFRIDRNTGAAVLVAGFPAGLEASGDLAFLGGRLLASARRSASSLDTLVEFDVASHSARVVGEIGSRCVWGLAALGTTLYGLTCDGGVLVIDGTTGMGREVAVGAAMFNGATAR